VGVLAASRRGSTTDTALNALMQVGVALPNFWIGLLLILVFSTQLHWFAAGGFVGWDAGLFTALKGLLLPAIALAAPQAAIIARVLRTALLETMNEDYVRTARAKGLSPLRVYGLHALRNAMITVVTAIGLQVGTLMAGAILTETIFSWPGIGKWIIFSVFSRDYYAVQGGLVLIAMVIMSVNLLVDVLYGLINPRIMHTDS